MLTALCRDPASWTTLTSERDLHHGQLFNHGARVLRNCRVEARFQRVSMCPQVDQAPDLLPASSFRPDVGPLEGPAGGRHGVGRRQRFHLQSQMQGEAVVAAVEIAVRELLDAFEALVERRSMDAE